MIRPEYLQTLFIPKETKESQSTPDWSQSFAILTAFDPGGKRHDDAVNQIANRKLRTRLNQRRTRNSPLLVKIDAVSEDWSHTEKSFAAWGLDHATAAKIGRDFGQDAYFWVENGTVTVHSCTTTNPPTFQILGRWEDRIRTRDDRPARNIYVIQLDPSVLEKRAFKEKNPNYQSGKDCLYVGTSIYPPEERYAQHKSGEKASSYVKNYGLRLLPELYQDQPFLTANNYVEEEKAYAEALRIQGHAVWQN
jgi:predicted GIY-YIG superfamily endonuclease